MPRRKYIAKSDEPPFVIAIDKREKLPFDFSSTGTPTEAKLLESGDYSLLGFEGAVAIERKRPVELFSNFTRHRDRFRREYVRLSQFEYAAVVIEGDLPSCSVRSSEYSSVDPSMVINSLISWSIRYNVHTWFASSRDLAQTLTYRILEKFYRLQLEKC